VVLLIPLREYLQAYHHLYHSRAMKADPGELAGKDFEQALVEQLRNRLAADLMVNCFDALLEVAPAEDCLNAIRPHAKRAGMAMAANTRERLDIQGNRLEALAMPFYWLHLAISEGQCAAPEVWEGGVVMEVLRCPLSRGRPEICLAESHFYAEGICESVDPEYEFIFTHHLTDGDAVCRCVLRQRGGSFTNEALGEWKGHMPRIELTEEEGRHLSNQVFLDGLILFTRAAIDLKVEDRLLDELRATNHALGRQIGLFLVNEFEGNLEGLEGAERAIELCTTAWGFPASEEGFIDEGAGLEISTCALKGAPEQVCQQLEMALNGVCQAIEPDSEVVHHHRSSGGGATCHWALREKRAGGKKGRQDRPSTDNEGAEDPARALTMRMINREITEEEYERKLNLILKHYLRP
jgi:hypothetical protein